MSNKTMSKRQELKEMRRQQERRSRLLTIGAIALIVIVLVAVLVTPSIRNAAAPVGEFVQITPVERPNAQGTAMGDPNAPVKIEIFEDYQCPACVSYSKNVEPEVVKNLVSTGQVYYVFRNYPFIDDKAASKDSDQAANASMCAAEQGRFWDFHDMLYANSKETPGIFSDKRMLAFAEALELDMTKFETCYNNGAYQDTINKDITDANKMGVNGTPSLFVNGKQIAPGFVPSYAQINTAIEEALQGR